MKREAFFCSLTCTTNVALTLLYALISVTNDWENTGIFFNNPTRYNTIVYYRVSQVLSSQRIKKYKTFLTSQLIEMKLNPNKTSSRRKMRKAHLSASSSERRERMVCGLSKDQFTKYHVCNHQLLFRILISKYRLCLGPITSRYKRGWGKSSPW